MPKLKTHKGAAKRFSKSGSGKIMRSKAYKRHLLVNKKRKLKRDLSKKVELQSCDVKRIKRLLPYL